MRRGLREENRLHSAGNKKPASGGFFVDQALQRNQPVMPLT
jgi:hypothetical protein